MRKSLKEMVEEVLKAYPNTRNNDTDLLIQIWRNYYKVIYMINRFEFVRLEDLKSVPSQDDVKRIRAYFQNSKELYLPTDPEVIKQRRQNEEEWHEEMKK